MTQTPQQKTEDWEKEFDKEIMCDCEEDGHSNHTVSNPKIIKEFIRQTLSDRDSYWLKKINEDKKLNQGFSKGMKKILLKIKWLCWMIFGTPLCLFILLVFYFWQGIKRFFRMMNESFWEYEKEIL